MIGINHPPAEILAQALLGLELVTPQDDAGEWPIYIGNLPATPDEAVSIHDVEGILDGRLMDSGEYIEHPGFQLRIRVKATDYLRGWRKANSLANALASSIRGTVEVDDTAYTIDSVTLSSPPIPMGQDPDTQRRQNFSINGRISLHLAE